MAPPWVQMIAHWALRLVGRGASIGIRRDGGYQIHAKVHFGYTFPSPGIVPFAEPFCFGWTQSRATPKPLNPQPRSTSFASSSPPIP